MSTLTASATVVLSPVSERMLAPAHQQTGLLRAIAAGRLRSHTFFNDHDPAELASIQALRTGGILRLAGSAAGDSEEDVVVRLTADPKLIPLSTISAERALKWSLLDGRAADYIAAKRRLGATAAWFIALSVSAPHNTMFQCHDCGTHSPLAAFPLCDPTSSSGACKLCGSGAWSIIPSSL